MSDPDAITAYDYRLPPELIAQRPPESRSGARMLCLPRETGAPRHARVTDLRDELRSGDLLVLNSTRVVRAQLAGVREATGGKWSGLFLRADSNGWELLGKTRGRPNPGEVIVLQRGSDSYRLMLRERLSGGRWLAEPESAETVETVLDRVGDVPLPPYVRREEADPSDVDRYQTVFAREPGSVAAPTAGLHFSDELLEHVRERGVRTAFVTLHVGLGTFRPVEVDRLDDHQMHSERASLPACTVEAIEATRSRGGRVIAVGTTVVRTLESVAATGPLREWSGETDLFIRPPWNFRAVDGLLTNFHLPKSTLLVLVSALAGRDRVLAAYEEAVRERYRFFSYGDAMLIT